MKNTINTIVKTIAVFSMLSLSACGIQQNAVDFQLPNKTETIIDDNAMEKSPLNDRFSRHQQQIRPSVDSKEEPTLRFFPDMSQETYMGDGYFDEIPKITIFELKF